MAVVAPIRRAIEFHTGRHKSIPLLNVAKFIKTRLLPKLKRDRASVSTQCVSNNVAQNGIQGAETAGRATSEMLAKQGGTLLNHFPFLF